MKDKLDFRLDKRELETIHTKVTRMLREAIVRGDFAPGERLVQNELAASFGVSRMPIREALRILEVEGLVTIEPHRGAVVNPSIVENMEEFYVLRAQFEKMAVEQSVPRIESSEIKELESLILQMDKTTEHYEFEKANLEFHNLLIKHCSWKRLLFFIETLWKNFYPLTPHFVLDENYIWKTNNEHREILEAVKEGNAQKAAELLSQHITTAGKEMVETMKKKKQ